MRSDRTVTGGGGVRRGYTLIELIAVMTLVSALAITVIPALGAIERSRQGAMEREVERRLTLARARAAASGERTGVRFSLSDGVIQMVRLAEGDAAATPMPGSTGDASEPLVIASVFPGASVDALRNGGDAAADETIWFDPDGAPEVRASDGTFEPFTRDATLTLNGSSTLIVRRLTGYVER